MESNHNIKLTSAEISNLWSNFMSDSMAICILSYFLQKVKDLQIKPVIELALSISKKHNKQIVSIYEQEKHPIPNAFTLEKDVTFNASSLFEDSFYLHYLKQMARIGLNSYGLSLSLSARGDIRDYYNDCLNDVRTLDNEVTNILLNKGLYIRAPFTSIPDKVEYVKDKNFIDDFVGEKRPLLTVEIAHIYGNIQTNALGKSLVMAFSQAANTTKVRKLMVIGRDIAQKHIEALSNKLHESQLKTPMTWDDTVTNSTESPFSDQLMMFHVSSVISVAIADYGMALGMSVRKDLALLYSKFIVQLGLYADDAAKLMIENQWFEKPPQADDRDALAEKN
jgi:hypothetical protein